ncbi:MAG: SMC family ATPase [Chloroflexi bacterium]|nr:SMC family ATPase [Chloroflexota bacterium]
MIPVKLTLRNFMPYRDNLPVLNFTGIHTVSICGENGSGKSALIDAMTWALWGKARAKSDDDLIHLGQTEMEVEFDFAVGQQTYRIIRKHAKPKRQRASGRTILEFQVASDNGFRPITGNTIQQTQQEIIKVLHMDYPTFINSSLLLQGRADEFTIASPARRKQVLADILGLSFYDGLEEQARELAKEQEAAKALAESVIGDISDELARKLAYEVELEQAQSKLASLEKAIKEQESRLNELRQQQELLKNKQWQLARLEEQLKKTNEDLQRWNEQVNQRRRIIKEYEELIARRAAIEEGYTQFAEAKKLSEELNQKLRLLLRLNERKSQLEMAIVKSSQALLRDHTLAQDGISKLEQSYQKLPRLQSELQQAQAELRQLAGEETVLNQKRQASQELHTHLRSLESGEARLEQEIAEIEEKLALLSTHTEAKCPLCERELEMEGLKLIESKYTAEKQNKSEALKLNQSQLEQSKKELDLLENEKAQLEARLVQQRTSAQTKADLFNREVTEAEEAGNQLDGAKKRLAEIEERLARKDFATSEQAGLNQLEDELAQLAYDSQYHEHVRQRLTDLEQYESPRRKLEEAEGHIGQEKEVLTTAEQAAQALLISLEADNQKRQELAAEISSFPEPGNELALAETEHQKLSSEQKQAQEIVGSVKEKLQRCAELEIRKQEKEKQLAQAAREAKIYRDLGQAFGKTGVQAWLIEMALPEIEVETNKLLGRMTDNRMHVKIETQRETKTGELRETLDITIADELGTRNYEMFSGGEAFRINFAIRIALSKLLARRAGAPLPTLIIDEGFGTQDATGLEKLKDAITSIQDDFDKIIVITHVEELRDAFPNRIDVIKTAEGSTFEVS